MLGFVAAHGFLAYPENVAPDSAEIERVEGQYFRPIIKRGQDCSQIFGRGSANAAQILRNDEVWSEASQSFGIHGIDALASGSELADQAVDFERRRIFVNARVNDNGLGARGGRVVAFVADTNHLLTQAEREQNFRRGGQERNNTHPGHLRTLAQHQETSAICKENICAASARILPVSLATI